MALAPRWLKDFVKRTGWLRAIYSRVAWPLHRLQDWWGTRVWTRTRRVRTPLGFLLTSGLHPAYAQMREGTFEVAETAVLSALLAQSDRFVDVGANLGYYTLLALQRGVPAVAFEPQPQNLRCLYANLVENGWEDRAEVLPVALAARPGLLTLYGASGPSASLVRGWAGYSSRHRQQVPVSTLDGLVGERFPGERLLVKIDVEGAEYHVLQGAAHTLARRPSPAWLLEVCLQEFHPDGSNPDFEAVFAMFREHGYRAYAVTDRLVPVSYEEVAAWRAQGRSALPTFNYLFLADGRPAPDVSAGPAART